jgi:hypothetical protein
MIRWPTVHATTATLIAALGALVVFAVFAAA